MIRRVKWHHFVTILIMLLFMVLYHYFPANEVNEGGELLPFKEPLSMATFPMDDNSYYTEASDVDLMDFYNARGFTMLPEERSSFWVLALQQEGYNALFHQVDCLLFLKDNNTTFWLKITYQTSAVPVLPSFMMPARFIGLGNLSVCKGSPIAVQKEDVEVASLVATNNTVSYNTGINKGSTGNGLIMPLPEEPKTLWEGKVN